MTLGLLLTSVTLGLRHGIDWDHIAAIADLTNSSDSRRRGLLWSVLYATGHAFVVFCLGSVAILAGASIPQSVDVWMSKIVGITLIGLGGWIVIELARQGRAFRLRSRWMLIISSTSAGLRRARRHRASDSNTISRTSSADPTAHELPAEAPAFVSTAIATDPLARPGAHAHRHGDHAPVDHTGRYGNSMATGIGMLHGIGVESPTQITLFVASTSVGGTSIGMMLLAGWVSGLVAANFGLAVLASLGLLHAERNFAVYATLAVIVGGLSVAMGALLVAGTDLLPEINL